MKEQLHSLRAFRASPPKRNSIANVIAPHLSDVKPRIQKSDAVKDYIWSAAPLDLDLTEQTRRVLANQMGTSLLIEKRSAS